MEVSGVRRLKTLKSENAKLNMMLAELPPEIRTLTQATICCLLVFDEEEIRDVETEATCA
ncbi:hypothetical protein SAMN04488037_107230 [Shimia marina]|jgi:hypothetical protein|nr:hypothetical protein SAMN04488037_107230 [Shimia marina]